MTRVGRALVREGTRREMSGRTGHARPRSWPLTAAALALMAATSLGAQHPGSTPAPTSDELFDSGRGLARIDLRLHSQDWQKLKQHFQENTYYPADVVFNGHTVRNVGIRSRGNGSRRESKPGLRVDFDRYVTAQRFLGLKSIVLDNLAQDPSGVRDATAARLYARLGVPVSRERHARLYVNNEYAGLYAIVESIDKAFLARVFGTRDGNVQNDGYLFEYKWLGPWHLGYLGADFGPYQERFSPRTHEDASAVEKFAPIEQLVRLANELPPERLVAELHPHLDLGALVRLVAAQAFVADTDGFTGIYGVNNFYLYRLEGSARHVLIAWDNDHAFSAPDRPIDEGLDENVLMRRAMQVPALRALYFDVLEEAAAIAEEGRLSAEDPGWLEHQVRQQLEMIYTAMAEDAHRPYALDAHHRAYDELIGFARERPHHVREQIAQYR